MLCHNCSFFRRNAALWLLGGRIPIEDESWCYACWPTVVHAKKGQHNCKMHLKGYKMVDGMGG